MKIIITLGISLCASLAHSQLVNKLHSNNNSGNYMNSKSGVKTSDQSIIVAGSMMMGGSFIIKIDAAGDTVWTKQIDSGFSLYLNTVTESADGSIYVSSADGTNLKTAKLDGAGNTLWLNKYNFTFDPYTNNVVNIGEGPGVVTAVGTSSDTLLLYNTNGAGNAIWGHKIKLNGLHTGSSISTSVNGIAKNSSGNYIITGTTSSNSNPGYMFITEISPTGMVLWVTTKEFNNGQVDQINPNSISMAMNGDILVSGRMSTGGIVASYFSRYSSSGNLIWSKINNDGAQGAQIIELSSGDLALNIKSTFMVNDGNPKFGLMKTDAAGNYIWGRNFGSTSNLEMGYLMEDGSGNILVINSETAFTNGVTMMAYNCSSTGEAIGCFDIMVDPTIMDWTMPTGTTGAMPSPLMFSPSTETFTENVFPLAYYNILLSTTGVVTNPLCNEEDGFITYSVNGGANPYSYAWSNGTNSQNLVNATAGTYTVWTSDSKGCVELDTFDIVEPTELVPTSVISNVTCFGSQNGSIDITTSGGTPGYTYLWATQDVTEDISGLSGGFYQVIITDANNCDETFGFAISEPQQLFAAITSSQNVSCYGACDGSLSGLASGGTSPYVLGWNDVNNTVGSNVSNLCPGNYLFTVTDNNNCVSYSNGTITEPLPITSTTAASGSECGVANGEASIDVFGGTMPYSYSWSDGDVSDTATSLTPGSYDVTVTDNNGCIINESVTVNTLTNPIEICVVTVDSTDNKNMIVWTKPSALNIQGFYIYRNIAGAYSQIGYQPYDSISQFIDNSFGVDPAVTSYRYEISVLDSCGNESDLSSFHETIHLTSNLGLNDEVNLIWDDYEGFSFTQYNILRDSTGNGNWEQIANVANTSFTYTDLTPPQSSSLRYLVEVVLPSTCSATKAQDHNTTRSNRATIADPNSGGGTSITELILSQAKVYPNPSKGLFTVNVKSDNWNYSLFDMSGKLLSRENVLENNTTVDIQELETGIYLMKIDLDNNSIYKKVIKQ